MEHHRAPSQRSAERWVSSPQKGAEHLVSSLEKEYESLDSVVPWRGSLASGISGCRDLGRELGTGTHSAVRLVFPRLKALR